jgi:hypothetical protein
MAEKNLKPLEMPKLQHLKVWSITKRKEIGKLKF